MTPYREQLDDAGTFLTLAARGRRTTEEGRRLGDLWRRLGAERCREIARLNKVSALVASALGDVLGAELPAFERELLAKNEARVRGLLDALREVLDRCGAQRDQIAVVEGGGTLLDSDLPLCAYGAGDFDLLVGHDAWPELVAALDAKGFARADRRGRPTTRGEFVRRTDRGGEQWLAAGTDSFDRMWVPLDLCDRSQQWLARSVPSKKSADVRVLAPEDALVFVSLHTSMHSYVRSPGIRLYVDIDRLVRDRPIDWARYIDELRGTHGTRRGFVSLALCASLLESPIPDHVLAALEPGALRWSALRGLLEKERVVANGRGKLSRGSTLLLDALISERSALGWARSVVLPDSSWMRIHFGGTEREPPAVLHLRRMRAAVRRWRPE